MGIVCFSDGAVFRSDDPALHEYRSNLRFTSPVIWGKPWANTAELLKAAAEWGDATPDNPTSNARNYLNKSRKRLENLDTIEHAGFWRRWWNRLNLADGPVGNDYRVVLPIFTGGLILLTTGIVRGPATIIQVGTVAVLAISIIAMIWHARYRAIKELARRREQVKEDQEHDDLKPSARAVARYLSAELGTVCRSKLVNTNAIRMGLGAAKRLTDQSIEGTRVRLHVPLDPRILTADDAVVVFDETIALLKAHVTRVDIELYDYYETSSEAQDRLAENLDRVNEAFELIYAAARIVAKGGERRPIEDIVTDPDWQKLRIRLLELNAAAANPTKA